MYSSTSTYKLEKVDEMGKKSVKKWYCFEHDNGAYAGKGHFNEVLENGGMNIEQEEAERVELNQRVEAFIAMFKQHLVSDAKSKPSHTSIHSLDTVRPFYASITLQRT
ncbi:hypothetical protein Ancab_034672 [Ancistrocladus abbreviatus]